MRFAASLVLIAGCGQLFQLERLPPPDARFGADANPSDTAADAFDPAVVCPATFVELPGAPPTSRYKYRSTADFAKAHHDACLAELQGFTHLAVAEAPQEQIAFQTYLDTTSVYGMWIGAVQPPDQAGVSVGWIWLTGGTVPVGAWNASEPNDLADGIEDNQENAAHLVNGRPGLTDGSTQQRFTSLCECDGKPLDTGALAAYAALSD